MNKDSIFSVLGPIMIGPSSSHTAGAVRIGRAARTIFNKNIVKAQFRLHGSFAETYKGHGTDRALVAGILGMKPDDENIRESFKIAEEQGIKVSFEAVNLGDVHPNTVEIILYMLDDSSVNVKASSIGGGAIKIIEIDGEKVNFNGDLPVLIVRHMDQQGMISNMTGIIADAGINIANLRVTREGKGQIATTIIETDTIVSPINVKKIESLYGIISVRAIDCI